MAYSERKHESANLLSRTNAEACETSTAHPGQSSSASRQGVVFPDTTRPPQTSDVASGQYTALETETCSLPSSNTTTSPQEELSKASSKCNRARGLPHQSRPLLGDWGWELGSFICALAVFAAAVVLLKTFDGKSQPDWPYGITLNSAISFLTTMIKAFLLASAASCISQTIWISYTLRSQSLDRLAVYDSASRGPWGSVQLLWALKMRRLACMGALLTLFAVGIDPTVQQAIAIRTRNRAEVSQAHIPRAQSFVEWQALSTSNAYLLMVPTVSMVGSLYSGMYYGSSQEGRASLDVLPDCPTGECNFPPYQTLSVCSECKDITNLVNTTCYTQRLNLYHRKDLYTMKTCRSTLSNSLELFQTISEIDYGVPFNATDGQTMVASTYLPLVEPTSHGPNIMSLTTMNGTTWKGQMTTSASQCVLYWCIKTHEAAVGNGELTEHELDSWFDPHVTFSSKGVRDGALTLNAPSNGLLNASSSFVVGQRAHASLVSWFKSSLTFSDGFAPIANDSHPVWLPDFTNNFTKCQDESCYSSIRTDSISDYTNNIQLFNILRQVRQFGPVELASNIAKAMTTYIRTLDASAQSLGFTSSDFGPLPADEPSTFEISGIGPANGTAYTLQVYIHVRWGWISFTGFILLLTCIFFALVVAQSARHKVAVWKSSPLALLFHGLETQEDEYEGRDDVASMSRRAGKMRARLGDTTSGIKLKNEHITSS